MILKNIYTSLVGVFLSVSLTVPFSCSKEPFDLTAKIPPVKSRLCMTAIITPDSIYVDLTRNLPRNFQFQGKDPFQIPDTTAIINVYENGVFFCKLSPQSKIINNGYSNEYVKFFYVSYKKATEGKTYKITVTHKDYEGISAETILPPKVSVLSIDTVNFYKNERLVRNITVKQDSGYIVYQEFIDTTVLYTRYTVYFQDPDLITNYYSVEALEKLSTGISLNIFLGYDDPIIENKLSRNQDYLPHVLFSDKFIQGRKYGFSFSFRASHDKILVFRLHNVSIDYYKYLLSVWINNATIGDKYREPVTIYSNVNRGYGILAAYSTAIYEQKYE